MDTLQRIGLLVQPSRRNSCPLADVAERLLRARGVDIWRGHADDESALASEAASLDLLITLGGDGTIVSAVRAVAAAGVPVLGVNLGRLGFLAEIEPARLEENLALLLQQKYHIEERMMLHSEVWRAGSLLFQAEAVNDSVVARGSVVRTVEISVEVDGHQVMTQMADGIIVSTPTGSTAYCLSAGGPIVAPDLDCMTVTPIAAHLSIWHAIVIPPHRSLRLHLVRGQSVVHTIDGQLDTLLEVGDEVRHTSSRHRARFVRFASPGYFYETALRRLRWPDQTKE